MFTMNRVSVLMRRHSKLAMDLVIRLRLLCRLQDLTCRKMELILILLLKIKPGVMLKYLLRKTLRTFIPFRFLLRWEIM